MSIRVEFRIALLVMSFTTSLASFPKFPKVDGPSALAVPFRYLRASGSRRLTLLR